MHIAFFSQNWCCFKLVKFLSVIKYLTKKSKNLLVFLITLTCLLNGHARLSISQNVSFCRFIRKMGVCNENWKNVLPILSLRKFWSTHWNGDNWVQYMYYARHLLFFNSMIYIIVGTDWKYCRIMHLKKIRFFCMWLETLQYILLNACTLRKSRNMNRAKKVSNVLICGANIVVDYYGKIIKILHGCPFEGWTNRAWPSKPICQKGWDDRALLAQPSKGHPCRVLILLP